MDFRPSDRALHWQDRLRRFMDDKVLPRSAEYWAQVRAVNGWTGWVDARRLLPR